MSILYVTAYKDIGRGSWNTIYRQSTENYYKNFTTLAKSCKNLVCFADENTKKYIKDNILMKNDLVIDYNEEDTFFGKYLEKEQKAMQSDWYKTILRHRLHHPEHSIPEYNIVNHNKFHFIKRAKELFPTYDFYVWIDFHYTRHNDINNQYPLVFPDSLSIPKNKITIASFIKDENIPFMDIPMISITSYEIIMGSTFIMPKDIVDIFYEEYDKQLRISYERGIADDDQNIHLQLFHREPLLYNLLHSNKWGTFFNVLLKE